MKKMILVFLSALVLLLSITSFFPSQQAYAGDLCKQQLFTAQEWSSLVTKSSSAIGEEISSKLNGYRDVVGNCALKIVHTTDSVKYQKTEPVFFAPRDGGGFIYAFVTHWYRDVFGGVIGKNLVTKITWEIFESKHFHAKVVEDSSIFAPGQPEELDNFFKNLLPGES
ncbi:MAG TPA: hypothetical protein V6C63_19200 [Allocoleopsis sp.]